MTPKLCISSSTLRTLCWVDWFSCCSRSRTCCKKSSDVHIESRCLCSCVISESGIRSQSLPLSEEPGSAESDLESCLGSSAAAESWLPLQPHWSEPTAAGEHQVLGLKGRNRQKYGTICLGGKTHLLSHFQLLPDRLKLIAILCHFELGGC